MMLLILVPLQCITTWDFRTCVFRWLAYLHDFSESQGLVVELFLFVKKGLLANDITRHSLPDVFSRTPTKIELNP